jgi:hypothetical protein
MSLRVSWRDSEIAAVDDDAGVETAGRTLRSRRACPALRARWAGEPKNPDVTSTLLTRTLTRSVPNTRMRIGPVWRESSTFAVIRDLA